jgi:hypothetical protein
LEKKEHHIEPQELKNALLVDNRKFSIESSLIAPDFGGVDQSVITVI